MIYLDTHLTPARQAMNLLADHSAFQTSRNRQTTLRTTVNLSKRNSKAAISRDILVFVNSTGSYLTMTTEAGHVLFSLDNCDTLTASKIVAQVLTKLANFGMGR